MKEKNINQLRQEVFLFIVTYGLKTLSKKTLKNILIELKGGLKE